MFDAYRKLLRVEAPNLLARNRALHRMLVDGVNVEYTRSDGSIAGAQAQVIDFERPEQNDWLAVNQFTVVEGQQSRRPDIVVFVNGLPLGVIELKNPADEDATVWERRPAAANLQSLDPGAVHLQRGAGRLRRRAGPHRRARRRQGMVQAVAHDQRARGCGAGPARNCRSCSRGVFEPRRFLDLVRHFIVFEDDSAAARSQRRSPGYHQFHAVNVAVEETLRAANLAPEAEEAAGTYFARHSPGGEPGDRRVGVVWHTQGSGKSLTMAFYAGRLILHPAMENPTHRRAHRPQRPRRPAVRHVRALP